MRKSVLLFIILTVFFFGIFAESLAIKKEAAFDWCAEDYIKSEMKKFEESEKNIENKVLKSLIIQLPISSKILNIVIDSQKLQKLQLTI